MINFKRILIPKLHLEKKSKDIIRQFIRLSESARLVLIGEFAESNESPEETEAERIYQDYLLIYFKIIQSQ